MFSVRHCRRRFLFRSRSLISCLADAVEISNGSVIVIPSNVYEWSVTPLTNPYPVYSHINHSKNFNGERSLNGQLEDQEESGRVMLGYIFRFESGPTDQLSGLDISYVRFEVS
jgi:hypothetical protein